MADRHPHHPDRRRHQRPGPAAGGRHRLLVDRQRVGHPGRARAADPTRPPRPPRPAPPRRQTIGIQQRQPAGGDADQAGQPAGKTDYAQRSRTIEPVFGQVKTIQGGGQFMGRGLQACAAEWKLLCGTHNCSSYGARPRPPPADRHQPLDTALTGPTDHPHRRSHQCSGHPGGDMTPLCNRLVRVNCWRPSSRAGQVGELPELVVGMEAASGCRCRQARAGPTCPPQRVRCNGCSPRLPRPSSHRR
jgi:hypothetical protein